MSNEANAALLSGYNESEASLRSDPIFQELVASRARKSGNDISHELQDFHNLLLGLKLRHEAVAQDKDATESAIKARSARIGELREQLTSKSHELETLKSKYQEEEKIVNLAQESFEQPQWIKVGGEEVRMVLNRTQADLTADRKPIELEVAELEEDLQREKQELKRRLGLSNTLLSTVSELRSKMEMPREQREQIFGRDEEEEDAEQASAVEETGGKTDPRADAVSETREGSAQDSDAYK